MKTNISRRSFLTYSIGAAMTLWAGRGFAQTAKLPTAMKLSIAFEIITPGGFRYKPPYVGVWIENAQGMPVQTLALWYEQGGRGNRWLNDLRRWARNKLEGTTTGPTRQPGKFTLEWDNKDAKGNLLTQGEYYICIEMAREHGPYELFREKLNLTSSNVSKAFTPNGELKTVNLEYAKHS